MKITVAGQTIKITKILLVENSQEVYECEFAFDSVWDKYNKTAVFQLDNETPIDVLLSSDVCIIPWEVLQHEGTLRIGVVGTYENEVYPTLWTKIKIRDGVYTGVTGTEPTPSVYAQILDAYNTLLTTVNTKADADDLTALADTVAQIQNELIGVDALLGSGVIE